MLNTIGGRKAAACLTGLIILTGCFLLKGTVPQELVNAVQTLIAAYLAGNVATDVVVGITETAKIKAEQSPASESVVESPSADKIENINQRLYMVEKQTFDLSGAVNVQDQTIKQMISAISQQNGGQAQ